jgi:hypothetical protein
LKLLIQLQEASVSEGHENEFQLDEISWLPSVDDIYSSCCTKRYQDITGSQCGHELVAIL